MVNRLPIDELMAWQIHRPRMSTLPFEQLCFDNTGLEEVSMPEVRKFVSKHHWAFADDNFDLGQTNYMREQKIISKHSL